MMHRWIIAYSLAALLLSAGGCAGRGKAQPLAATGATQPPAAAEAGKPAADAAAANANRDADMIRMMGELQALGALDPKALDQLLKDLQQTDPALWPQVMQVFRASLAYRQRTLAKQSAGDADQVAAAASAAAETSALLAAPAGTPTSAGDGRQPAPLDGSLPVAAQPISAGAPTAPAVAGGLGAKGPAAAITSVAASGAKTDGLPAVRQVSYEQPIAEDHQQLLTKTIQALESSAGGNDPAAAQAARQVYLRMLYLAAGRRDDALRPIVGLPPNEQEFWSEQLFGLSTYLDADRSPDAKLRAAEARVHLNKAAGRLSESGELQVRNMAFCTEVISYGVFTPFANSQFKPGQQVILYAEVENFKSELTPKGFHTALRSNYQIFDQQGRRVVQHDLGTTEEVCRNARRDFFIRNFLTIPSRIYDGPYTLHLTIEDTLGHKIGQSTIDFTAHEK